MRRTTLGLAAAAVIAGSLGFGGVARALPAYVSLGTDASGVPPSPSLTAGPLTWYVVSCSTGSTNVCSNLVMYDSGLGTVTVSAAPSSGQFQPLSSVYVAGTVTDLTLTLAAYSGATQYSGANIISGASESEVITSGPGTGGSSGISTSVSSPVRHSVGLGTIGLPTSGHSGSVSFTPVNNVQYAMDIPLTPTLTTVTLGTPVPEPTAFDVLVVAMLLTVGARSYRARVNRSGG